MRSRKLPRDPAAAASPVRGRLLDRVLDLTGRLFVTTGLLMFAFVAYQLWGTGIEQAASQKQLGKQYEKQYSVALPGLPAEGDTVGRLSIPAIGVDTWMVAGAKLENLEKGPGIFANSVLPGQVGNMAIAGHRTSYGAPFENIDKLKVGDEMKFSTRAGSFTYRVTGNEVVSANQVEVLYTTDPSRAIVTLVTCHPKWTSSERLIVRGELIGLQKPMTATPITNIAQPTKEELTPGWLHDRSAVVPTILWALALIVIWQAGKRLAGDGWRRVFVWTGTFLVFAGALYMTFDSLSGLLPANL